MSFNTFIVIGFFLTLLPSLAFSQDQAGKAEAAKTKAYQIIESDKEKLAKMSDAIYSYSEPAFQEFNTVELLVDRYRKAGFRVETGIAGMPTAFVGVWGSGRPVIALMADYDAQLTSSQKPGVVHYDPLVEGAPGHGEGHNANPVVVYAAALALKDVMEEFGWSGTIKAIGGPAEESIASRGFMVKAGVWDGVDVGMDAHIARGASVKYGINNLALVSVLFTFKGEAEEFPFRRRNALSAVELFNIAMKYWGERLPRSSRTQHIVTGGGNSPNVSSPEASTWYYFREESADAVMRLFAEAKEVAEAVATISGTQVESKIRSGTWPLNQNKALTELTYKNMIAIGLPKWSEDDHAFFRAFQKTFRAKQVGVNYKIDSRLDGPRIAASSDAGDVTWVIPSTRLGFPGQFFIEGGGPFGRMVLNHQWTQSVTTGTPVTHKGILFGAKVMAATFIDILSNPDHLEKIRTDFQTQTKGYTWTSLIPDDVKPPLDVNKVEMDKYRSQLEKFHYDPDSSVPYLETLGIKYPPSER